MIAMTTSNSMRVKADDGLFLMGRDREGFKGGSGMKVH